VPPLADYAAATPFLELFPFNQPRYWFLLRLLSPIATLPNSVIDPSVHLLGATEVSSQPFAFPSFLEGDCIPWLCCPLFPEAIIARYEPFPGSSASLWDTRDSWGQTTSSFKLTFPFCFGAATSFFSKECKVPPKAFNSSFLTRSATREYCVTLLMTGESMTFLLQ